MQDFSSLPPPAPLPPPPAVTPARRSKRWPWVLAGGGGVVVVLAILTVIGLVAQLNSPLVDDNLNSGDGPFVAERDSLVTLEHADGGYRMLLAEGNSGPQMARSYWAPTVRSVRVEVTASVRGDAPEESFVGVACVAAGAIYALYIGVKGDSAIVRADVGKKTEILASSPPRSARLTSPVRLRLDCRGGGNGPTELTGYIDGAEVASAKDVESFESFGAIGVLAFADQQLDVLFDDPYAKEINAG